MPSGRPRTAHGIAAMERESGILDQRRQQRMQQRFCMQKEQLQKKRLEGRVRHGAVTARGILRGRRSRNGSNGSHLLVLVVSQPSQVEFAQAAVERERTKERSEAGSLQDAGEAKALARAQRRQVDTGAV